ncbi:ABC transporter 1 [Metarhizium anisopliae]
MAAGDDIASPVAASAQESATTDNASTGVTVATSPAKNNFFSFFQLLFYANPTWLDYLLLIFGTLCACCAGVPFPLMGILFGQVLDNLNDASCDAESSQSTGDIQSEVNKKVLILVYIAIANFIVIYLYIVSWSIFSRRLEARIRDRYFQTLLRQDSTFYDSRQAGELTSRLNSDIQIIQAGTSEKVGICIAVSSFFISSYVVAFVRNTKLAAILISLIPAFLLMAAITSIFTQKYAARMSDAIASASSIAQEALSHIAVVQAFGAGPRLEAKFASTMMTAQKEGMKKAVTAAIQAGTLFFISYSANALAFWQGSRQIADAVENGGNNVSVGRTYTVIFLLVDACVILGSIAPLLPIIGAATASFQKLKADIDAPSGIDSQSGDGDKLPNTIDGSVEFHNVSFAYVSRPDRPVLRGVSFSCPAGKHTALVGLSGSGKSTVAGLTARIYDPTDGIVTLDGHDLKNLNVKNLRSFMSLVQQEPSLLDRSILENIALGILNSPWPEHQRFQPVILGSGLAEIAAKLAAGKDLASLSEAHGPDMVDLVQLVREAASLADASGFIGRLEFGYGTQVGIGGKLVSGGQRQRIALARALIRDPKILILDEATASLDSASEHRIQMAIESIAKGRTVIAIAHRLSTIKNADNIIVMNGGEIIEQGSHLELMALNGSYAGMVRLQNIESFQNDDTPSMASTARGDVDTIITEKDSILEEKTADTFQAQDKEQLAPHSEGIIPASSNLDSNKTGWQIIKDLGRMMRPHLSWFLLAIAAGTIVGASFTGSGLIFGNTVGRLSPCNAPGDIRWAGKFFGGLFFMLAVIELLANSISWSSFGNISEKLLYKVRVLCFRSLYEQGLDWHQADGRTPASLLSVITADAAAIGGFSGSIIGNCFSIIVNFVIAIIVSHILAWKIAIVCLVTVPILLGSGILQLRALTRFERKHADAFSDAIGITVEAVNSFKTISSLSLENEILGNYRRTLRPPYKAMAAGTAYANIWLAISYGTSNLIYAFAYWWGSTRITKGEYTSTEFFVILVAMLVSAQLWGNMFSLAPEVSRAREAGSRILSLIEQGSSKDLAVTEMALLSTQTTAREDVEAAAEGPPKPASPNRGATVTFKDVSFAYPARPHIPIVQNMSFTIQAGQFCGLVGPSGAGKSTILSLVQRMYHPTGGAIEINGSNICAREGTEFRNDIAVVPQDCALFDGTIKFNVGLGATPNHEATDEEIKEACRLANIHDTVMALPDGYNTECGPNGSRLSGGQRQRLAIARALVRKPQLLLLDESTSALDAESEKALQEGLERAARGITVIAITHRLHTVRKADVIFVVEGGTIVEKGRHEELVERSETYRINALQQMLGS